MIYILKYLGPIHCHIIMTKEFVSFRMPKGIPLAVSEDKQLFTLMTQEELNQCKEGFFTTSPADSVLTDETTQHYLIALYLGNYEIVRKTCKRTIESKTFDAYGFEHQVKYSLSTPIKIVKQCQTLSPILESKTSIIMELHGTGMLSDTEKC